MSVEHRGTSFSQSHLGYNHKFTVQCSCAALIVGSGLSEQAAENASREAFITHVAEAADE